MNEKPIREIAGNVQRAYNIFLDAHFMSDAVEEEGSISPAIEKLFDQMDEDFWELMDCLNEAARRAPYTYTPSRKKTEKH